MLFLYKGVKDSLMNWVTFEGGGLESEKGNHADIQRKSFSRQSAPPPRTAGVLGREAAQKGTVGQVTTS